MKKKTVLKILLLLLPLAVVAVAVTPGSVTVLRDQELVTTTFATAVEGSMVGWCAPVALLLTYALFAMAVLYGVLKKEFWVKAIRAVSFVAACLAACPVLVQGAVRVIPNTFAAILLMVLWLVAHYIVKTKDAKEEEAPKGRRLNGK